VTALVVALWLIAGLLALVLFLPLSVRASGAAGEDELWGVAELRWGHSVAMARVGSEARGRFYLFGVPLFRLPSLLQSGEKKREKKKRKKRRRRRPVRQLLGDDRRLMVRMAARGLRALHVRCYLGGTVGLGDPMKTALLLAAVRHVGTVVVDRVELDVRDDYLEEKTQLHGRLRAWIIPAEAALILLFWLIRADTRQLLRGR